MAAEDKYKWAHNMQIRSASSLCLAARSGEPPRRRAGGSPDRLELVDGSKCQPAPVRAGRRSSSKPKCSNESDDDDNVSATCAIRSSAAYLTRLVIWFRHSAGCHVGRHEGRVVSRALGIRRRVGDDSRAADEAGAVHIGGQLAPSDSSAIPTAPPSDLI